jgi:hypothetical protein
MKLEFSRQIFEKISKTFFKIRPVGSQVVPCGQTERHSDGHGEANNRFSQFGERA